MKILLGLTGLGLDGGISSVSRSIARVVELERLRGAVDSVHHVLLEDESPPPESASPGSSYFLAGGSKSRFFVGMWLAILRFQPQLILFDHVGLGRALLPSLPLRRPPYDVFVHGLELIGASRDIRGKVLRAARRVHANSAFTAERLLNQMPELESRVNVVPLCVEPHRIEQWSATTKGNLELSSNTLIRESMAPESEVSRAREKAALIVGRMWSEQPGKGHDALIEGWPQVVSRIEGAELWIAGGGDDVLRLENLAREFGVEQYVKFLGRISDEELARRYLSASVFVMPSSQEGFGLVYLEAMWHGLPCIGSTADAAPCVIDATCGLLVPYGDASATATAIADLISDSERCEKLGAAGRRKVETEFSFEHFHSRFAESIGISRWSGPSSRGDQSRE